MSAEPMTDARFERILTAVRDHRPGAATTIPRVDEHHDRRVARGGEGAVPERHLTAGCLAEAISSRVLFQPEAVEAAARVLGVRLGVARLHPERPHAFLLATGPTGTGKTTLAGAIAEAVYGDPHRLVRIDCSELSSPSSVSALIGPPPGYVGFDRPDGWLTTRVEKLERGVVLFDEVEKAHPDIWRLLLQIGEGRLSDATGRTVSFASTTVMLTANVGAAEATRQTIGFGDTHRDAGQVMSHAVTKTFPPEMLGRVDATLVFRRLPSDANLDIAWRVWTEYQERMCRLGWNLELDRSVLHEAIGHVELDTKGARELERAIEFDLLAGLNGLEPGSYHASFAADRVTWNGCRVASRDLHALEG